MSCWFCVHWQDSGIYHVQDPIEQQEGVCTLEPEWTTTIGDHHCSRIVYRRVYSTNRTWAHDMMRQRDEYASELVKEKDKRIRLEKQNKALRRTLKEAKP